MTYQWLGNEGAESKNKKKHGEKEKRSLFPGRHGT